MLTMSITIKRFLWLEREKENALILKQSGESNQKVDHVTHTNT